MITAPPPQSCLAAHVITPQLRLHVAPPPSPLSTDKDNQEISQLGKR